ncbi:tetratricopeptide repeat protein [Bosea caraganae]|uniref:Tetratricopeptide repeat protein n=1 Tax=Bosea caraganae TaxID=2763117 RepID=A0A370KXQ5_9HYPH|nr:tetratricopeptide repeat protein [Bosea caraganae]RDJ19767.1 tetratricopeptide repeat protein [Bosea caraganae]RDJ21130.1 tetratricopeptide repeat protein [Bosea caraganae]
MPIDDKTKREVLEWLLSQPTLRLSKRNKQFLRFVAEESIAGRGNRIKAYTIAVEVFGRSPDFDGGLDPVVRIEAGRLRLGLAQYYANEGRLDPIRIAVPPGGYEPMFEVMSGSVLEAMAGDRVSPPAGQPSRNTQLSGAHVVASQAPASRDKTVFVRATLGFIHLRTLWKIVPIGALALAAAAYFWAPWQRDGATETPTAVVLRAVPVTSDVPTLALARTLSEALPASLARFGGLSVVAPMGDQSSEDVVAKVTGQASPSRKIYVVTMLVTIDDLVTRASWQVFNGRDQALLWSGASETRAGHGRSAAPEDAIAEKIAAAIASRGALIPSHERKTIVGNPTPGYACIARARDLFVLDDAIRKVLIDCLERTVAQNPEHGEAWGWLAYAYVDESRVQIADSNASAEALRRAAAAVERAERYAPYLATTYQFASTVAFQQGDIEKFERTAKRAIELNPSDPSLRITYGNRLEAIGRYDEGVAILKEAVASRPTPVATDYFVLVLDLYRRQQYREAVAMLERHPAPNLYHYWLMMAAAQSHLGNTAAASNAVKRLLEIRPNYGSLMRKDFQYRRFEQARIDDFAAALKKAGLAVD